MLLHFTEQGKSYSFDTSEPIDISIPLRAGKENVKAFYADDPRIEPLKVGSFIGDVLQGGSCNVNKLFLNPHCNGTHTECLGHISKEKQSLNQCLRQFLFLAQVITVTPENVNGDSVITGPLITRQFFRKDLEISPAALIIRTLPNQENKRTKNYSGTNPPYLDANAASWAREFGIQHLLIDLPSIDKEDDSKLLAHHAWWNYPGEPQIGSTITELIYIPDSIPDGCYLLNQQIASFENDASPSKPVLYKLKG
jgi:arylformamidase